MASSTNYQWSEPDNSSLVKDGALAMRTLGNAIDASLWSSGYGQAGKNAAINGSFQVWQRGTSVAVTSAAAFYTADRWQTYGNSSQNTTFSQQPTGDTTNLPDIQYCARVQRNSGQTGTGTINFAQSLESINTRRFTGKPVTLSFYARRGANYSQTGNALGAYLYTGTGTDQNVISGYTGGAIPLAVSTTLTTTWQRFSATVTLGTTVTEMGIRFQYDPTGTAGANDYFEVTGVQLEYGSTATPFQTASGGSIQGELAMCQRYYWRNSGASANNVILPFCGVSGSTTSPVYNIAPPVTMRIAPTSVDFANLQAIDQVAGYALSSIAVNGNSQPNVIFITASATGLTAFRPLAINASTSNAYLGFSAEL